MRNVTYSLTVSLDGYVVGPDGGFDWATPDEEVFRFATDEVRALDVHLLGRRLYETMLYWETVDHASLDDAELEFAALWNALPKVVFSSTLSAVQGNARLASASLADEIERLRTEPEAKGNIGIGGATLAAHAAALDLIDEYRARVHPVLLGGGIPFYPGGERRVDLELVETRVFNSKVVFMHNRVLR